MTKTPEHRKTRLKEARELRGLTQEEFAAHRSDKSACSNTSVVRMAALDAFIAELQTRLAIGESLQAILAVEDNREQIERRREQLEAEIKDVTAQSRRMLDKQRTAHKSLEDVYDEQINAIGVKLAALEEQLEATQFEVTYDQAAQEQEAKDFVQLGASLWTLPDADFNARLNRLFGQRRLSAYMGQVVGFEDAPRKRTYN